MAGQTEDVAGRIKAARRVATPLVGVSTPDQHAMVHAIREAFADKLIPLVTWDCLRGLRPANDEGAKSLANLGGTPEAMTHGAEAWPAIAQLTAGSIVVAHNADAALRDDAVVIQAAANLRDILASNGSMLVMLAPAFDPPAALTHDIMVLDDPLPSVEKLTAAVTTVAKDYKSANGKFAIPSADALADAGRALRGLSAFEAEQAASLAVSTHKSLAPEHLQGYRDGLVENVKGLSVDRSPYTFTDICGVERARWFIDRLCNGPEKPSVILRIDEIEKRMGGHSQTTEGGATGADELQVLLTSMEDYGWSGVIAYGHPGTAKTMWTRAAGPTHGIPTLDLDMGATRSKFVGESEAQIRQAIRTVRAIGNSRVYVMATANDLNTLRPELKRRFTDGVFFFDLPDAAERQAMWTLYVEKYGLTLEPGESAATFAAEHSNWTGAEIRNTCQLAHRLSVALSEAAKDTIPVALADPDSIKRRREHADRRYRNAAAPGAYILEAATGRPGRHFVN